MMMVFDGEWIKEAFIKNFSVFTDRRRVLQGSSVDSGLLVLESDHWKFVRKLISPEFASGKLKKVCLHNIFYLVSHPNALCET